MVIRAQIICSCSITTVLIVNCEALRRLKNAPGSSGVEHWGRCVDHHEPKQLGLFLGIILQIMTYAAGDLTQVIDRLGMFKLLGGRYDKQ